MLDKLSSKDPNFDELRKNIFERLRNPDLYSDDHFESGEAKEQASPTYMPQLSGDSGDNAFGEIQNLAGTFAKTIR